MTLPVLFRSHGGENQKGRPDWFSKLVCLLSAVRAAEAADTELVFVNNGPIPEPRLEVMRRAGGEIVDLPNLGIRQSYLAALELATSGRWDDDQVVWFSEDDYLYQPDSFRRLQDAVPALPDAQYFGLYGSNPENPHPRPEPLPHRPRGWQDLGPREVDGHSWVRLYSTTATFGGRVGPLREDLPIFRFATVPHKNMFRDHDTCLMYQGFETYSYGRIARDALGLHPGTPKERLREVVMSPFYLATNLRSHRRASRRRLLVSAEPSLATHVELGYIAPGTDWAATAAETMAWAEDRDLLAHDLPA
ncbi:glycosyltransferase family 2 protein [Modestobacter muralis]|uniref:Glycosyltransferase family 2 protein n=1 Tax=Modestobacter muralis TaxID=1608614 RepID=A0A6P0H6Q8_9ACTN|nr:glycosyltransferase family 2 protein [Modestobacter muralis]NEK94512.1 glycosyltransferase family 2 protein [Modestobacter muralis]NEN51400.1 glycosyltransferase family 2 protein [Modestobacter muralis]